MALLARTLVSKQKRRFQEEGFNLDLTYITENILAMGFPSERLEGLFRNPLSEVVRFLETRHKGHYKVYNLCSERNYENSKFPGPVAHYPFEDHNAPPFGLIRPFCEDVQDFLKQDPKNVVAVHCKAGKGRTGVMICCYLLFIGRFSNPDAAMQYYGIARTKNGKGVTIPSQQRYIHYFGYFIQNNCTYTPVTRRLLQIYLSSLPKIPRAVIWFEIYLQDQLLHTSNPISSSEEAPISSRPTTLEIDTSHVDPISGDIKVVFYLSERKYGKDKSKLLFQFWFNTYFVQGDKTEFLKMELDKANKDKSHILFPSNFQVALNFEPLQENPLQTSNAVAETKIGEQSVSSELRKSFSATIDRPLQNRKPRAPPKEDNFYPTATAATASSPDRKSMTLPNPTARLKFYDTTEANMEAPGTIRVSISDDSLSSASGDYNEDASNSAKEPTLRPESIVLSNSIPDLKTLKELGESNDLRNQKEPKESKDEIPKLSEAKKLRKFKAASAVNPLPPSQASSRRSSVSSETSNVSEKKLKKKVRESLIIKEEEKDQEAGIKKKKKKKEGEKDQKGSSSNSEEEDSSKPEKLEKEKMKSKRPKSKLKSKLQESIEENEEKVAPPPTDPNSLKNRRKTIAIGEKWDVGVAEVGHVTNNFL